MTKIIKDNFNLLHKAFDKQQEKFVICEAGGSFPQASLKYLKNTLINFSADEGTNSPTQPNGGYTTSQFKVDGQFAKTQI